ncbi:hypothetical protein FACS1894167_13980 [Synergistales bacterium]|nr:hypothetical protein FACS1894167_13980 [Synergistales bacterium]
MAAHAIAAQLHRKLLIVDYSQIESKYVGETSKNISSLFEYAKSEQCVLFFDEADALLSKRVTNMSHSTDVSVNQTRSHLLLLINEYEDILLFATNFISNYDQAFMRRISAHIKFELPNADNRAKLWQIYIPEGLPTDININELVAKSDGASGADIANAVMQAALRAARQNETIVRSSYFEDAINQIVESKLANNNEETVISRRTVSEEYAKQQLGGGIER